VGGVVVKVTIVSPFVAVDELQGATLSLVAGRVGVCGIVGKVEAVQRRVAGAGVGSEQEPCLFFLRPGVEELELSVRDATIAGVHGGRLRPVPLTDDLDKALAVVDFVAEDLAEVAVLGSEDFLNDGRVAQPYKDGGDSAACPPELRRDVNYEDIVEDDLLVGPLVENLTRREVLGSDGAHLDPDLRYEAIQGRPVGWLPSLGHAGGAQTQLANKDVGEGDLFLFFGWFRSVSNVAGKWRYIAGAPDLHVVFGWLQIGEIVPIGGYPSTVIANYPWLAYHPHLANSYAHWKGHENNTIYVARRCLSLPGIEGNKIAGGGVFRRFNSSLLLTAPSQPNRSLWLLPGSFFPKDKHTMTFHSNEARWQRRDAGYLLQTVGRGQEFILETKDYPGIISWTASLFKLLGNC
jgi:hypothetical protein